MFRPLRFLALAALLLTTACSGGGTSAPTTTSSAATNDPGSSAPATTGATATTLSPADQAMAYHDVGPYPVGVTTMQLEKGPLVEVWYPAVTGSNGVETYDIRDFLPEAIRTLITTEVDSTHSYAATRDAVAADGSFPIVLFSHGFSGFRLQSTFLTADLASWGMIVVSPEHPSRDLAASISGTASMRRADSVDDLLQALDLVTAAGEDSASVLHGHVDASRVAAVGHSAGGVTALFAADDPRIDGYVSLASGVLAEVSAATPGTAVADTSATLPAKPSLFVAGSVDEVVNADTITRVAYDAAPSPSSLWVITGVGHNGFDDVCTFGNGTGLAGLADAAGLGALLDATPGLRTGATTGCIPPALPVATTFPIIRHVVTAWLRALFGDDAAAVGIGPEVADQYPTPVVISQK